MKLERPVSRLQPIHAAEALAREEEHQELLFDPGTDFDQKVKEGALVDFSKPEALWGPWTNKMEFFLALFPEECKAARLNLKSKNLKRREIIRFRNKRKDPQPFDYEGDPDLAFEKRKFLFKSAEKFLLIYPGELKSLGFDEKDRKESERVLEECRGRDFEYIDFLFWRIFLFPETPLSNEEKDQMKMEAFRNITDYRKDFWPSDWMSSLAQLRLCFPDQEDIFVLSTKEIDRIKKQLRFFAQAVLTEGESVQRTEDRGNYIAMAWAATILSAETVRMTSDGRIEFELPKKSIKSGRKLPDRQGM